MSGNFNNQGSIDLAIANLYSSNVTILLDFDGTKFTSVQQVSVGNLPRSFASGHFDADAGLDLAVANESNNSLTILRNSGNGTFTADATTLSVGNSPFAVVATQLTDDNGDRIANDNDKVDLVVANLGRGADRGSVSVLLNNGSGSFNAPISYQAGLGPIAVSAADLNLDGFADLAVANFLSNTITVLVNKQDGAFPPKTDPQRLDDLPGGSVPADLETADMDNDGDVDLVVTNLLSKDISILRNQQSQTGFGFEPGESFGLGEFPAAVQLKVSAGDVNQDGVVDLAVANGTNDDSVSVFLNTLVGGAHRVGLTGVETVTGLSFAIQSFNLPPTLNVINNSGAIQEDDPQLKSIPLSGITDGGSGENNRWP